MAERRRNGRRGGGIVTSVLSLSVLLVGLVAACDRDSSAGDDGADAGSMKATTERPRLELTIDPRTGDAPLPVVLEARLVGDLSGEPRAGCPSLAWDFGNDDVLFTKAEDCGPGAPAGRFTAEYTYRSAGSFEASVRLLASDVEPSGPVQLLVGGPTPTPPVVAAVPGPTIIIATPVEASRTGPTTAPAADARPTVVAMAPATSPPGVSTPSPRSDELMAARVLPADLYYVTSADNLLWVLPASGDAPRAIDGVTEPVGEYAVSAAGLVAYTANDALWLKVPGVPPLQVAGAGASAPLWSRDGRRLAYANAGLWVIDVAGYETTQLATEGEPIAWAPDGEELLFRLSDGRLGRQTATAGHLKILPVGTVHEAGWMPDRDVAWLAGEGLRLLSLGDVPTIVPLMGESSIVSDGYVRPDLRLLALVDDGGGSRAYEVDLTNPSLPVQPLGPYLDLADTAAFEWAPDGRTAAVASEAGLALLDPTSGASVPLVFEPSRDPQWVLRGQ